MHGVRNANYTSAGGAHMRQASAWCVDKHGIGSVRMTAMRISAVGMVREHGNEECQCRVQRTCMNWAGPLSKKCLMYEKCRRTRRRRRRRDIISSLSVKYEDGSRRHALDHVFKCLVSQMWGYGSIWCTPRDVFCFTSQAPCGRPYLHDTERMVGGTQHVKKSHTWSATCVRKGS